MRSRVVTFRLPEKEEEVIKRACEKLGTTFSEFARAALVSAALFVLGESNVKPQELAKKLGDDAVFLAVSGIRLIDGKATLAFHIPVEVYERLEEEVLVNRLVEAANKSIGG